MKPMPEPMSEPMLERGEPGGTPETGDTASVRNNRGFAGRLLAIFVGCAACAWIWTNTSYSWPEVGGFELGEDVYLEDGAPVGDVYGAEILDDTTREDVLEAIERSELYVLDVERIATHIHVQLEILVDGIPVVIDQTGVDMDTLTAAPIHTHDETGVLHIETDEVHPEAPTVADFLRLWQRDEGGNAACGWIVEGPCDLDATRNGARFELDDAVEDGDTVQIVIRRT